jgi:hypothetical protein
VTLWLVLLLPLLRANGAARSRRPSERPALAQRADLPPKPGERECPLLVLGGAPDWTMKRTRDRLVGCVVRVLAAFERRGRSSRFDDSAGAPSRCRPSANEHFGSGRQSVTPAGPRPYASSRDCRDCEASSGSIRRFIALSPAALAALSNADLDRVVTHEHAHVQRHDDVGRVLLVAIQAVFGLHPAVWWIGRAIDLEREIACDDWVLALDRRWPALRAVPDEARKCLAGPELVARARREPGDAAD